MLLVGALEPHMFRVAIVTFALFLFCFNCSFLLLFTGPGVGWEGWLMFLWSLIPSGGIPVFPFICGQVGWGFAGYVVLWAGGIVVFFSEGGGVAGRQ